MSRLPVIGLATKEFWLMLLCPARSKRPVLCKCIKEKDRHYINDGPGSRISEMEAEAVFPGLSHPGGACGCGRCSTGSISSLEFGRCRRSTLSRTVSSYYNCQACSGHVEISAAQARSLCRHMAS